MQKSLKTKTRTSPRDAASRARYRAQLGLSIGRRLDAVATAQGDAEAQAVADVIQEAARPENIWYGRGLRDDVGNSFEGYGSLVLATTRLDPAYMKACASRARVRTMEALGRVRVRSGYKLQFITFTIPSLFGFDAERAFNLLSIALVLLKKRKWFIDNVQGAVFGDEVTPGQHFTHFHFHSHMLGYTRELDVMELRWEWTDCLKKAAAKLGVVDLPINTSDGLAIANVKKVQQYGEARNSREMAFKEAIYETCKYTVEGTDFLKIPDEHLCQLHRVLRGRRLIVTYGDCNKAKGRVSKRQNLDEHRTNDGSEGRPAAAKKRSSEEVVEKLLETGARMIREGRREEWRRYLSDRLSRRRQWRMEQLRYKYPYAVFRTLAGEQWYGDLIEADHTHSLVPKKFIAGR